MLVVVVEAVSPPEEKADDDDDEAAEFLSLKVPKGLTFVEKSASFFIFSPLMAVLASDDVFPLPTFTPSSSSSSSSILDFPPPPPKMEGNAEAPPNVGG